MRIGNHVQLGEQSASQTIKENIARAKSAGINLAAIQIFVSGPANSRVMEKSRQDEIKKIIAETKIELYVHGSYFDNPWGPKANFATHNILRELAICDHIGASGLVIHLARAAPADITAAIKKICKNGAATKIFLEIESYFGNDLTYETPAKIAALANLLKSAGLINKVGFCIDTAHLWSAGVDIRSKEAAAQWIAGYSSAAAGFETIIHLNDQVYEFGSGRDEHHALGYGTIWSQDNSGILPFLEMGHTMILERRENKPAIPSVADNIKSDYSLISQLKN